jgi:hypothetical protein
VKPVLQALVLAERIWHTDDGRQIIAGTFNAVVIQPVPEPPTTSTSEPRIAKGGIPGTPSAYISLTDVCDGTKLLLQFVSLTRNQVLFEKEIEVKCKDRLAVIEIVVPLPQLPMHGPGVYAFEIVCEGEVIGSSRIIAKLSEE